MQAVDTITLTVQIVKMGKLIVLLVGGKGYSSVRIGTPCNTCDGDGYLNPYNHIVFVQTAQLSYTRRVSCSNCTEELLWKSVRQIRCKWCSSNTDNGGYIMEVYDCSSCGGGHYNYLGAGLDVNYHGICSSCNGTKYSIEKTDCTTCEGNRTIKCTDCKGKGYLLEPYSCDHGKSGGSSHYYCSSSSKHGNIVNQYH